MLIDEGVIAEDVETSSRIGNSDGDLRVSIRSSDGCSDFAVYSQNEKG